MDIESKFEKLENIVINNDFVREKVTDLKNEVITLLERSDNTGSSKLLCEIEYLSGLVATCRNKACKLASDQINLVVAQLRKQANSIHSEIKVSHNKSCSN